MKSMIKIPKSWAIKLKTLVLMEEIFRLDESRNRTHVSHVYVICNIYSTNINFLIVQKWDKNKPQLWSTFHGYVDSRHKTSLDKEYYRRQRER